MFGDNNEELSILLYVSTGQISASYALFSKNKIPNVLYSVNTSFPSNLKLDEDLSTKSMLSILNSNLDKLIKDGPKALTSKIKNKNINNVFITLSSPWHLSVSKGIHLNQEVPFLITSDFLQNILEVEEKNFEEEIEKNEINNLFVSDKLAVVENTFTHTKINGYSVTDNIGKKTKDFDIDLYSSFTSKKTLDDILVLVHKHTHLNADKIIINTFPLVFFYTIKNMFSSVNSFLFLNAEGEISTLTLVHDGAINQTISFPSAKNFILGQIAKSFDISSEIADSMLHMYNKGKLDNEVTQKMDDLFLDIEKEWSIYFEDALSELSKSSALPNTLYLLAENDVAMVYSNFLKISKADSTATFRKNLNIVYINKESFLNFCNFEKATLKNEYLGLQAVFYNKIKLGNF